MMGRLYSYNEITELHLELTSKCQAACPMCGRNVRGGRTRETIGLDEVSLENFRVWFSLEFLRQLKTMVFCGNFGDPIIATDCIPILSYVRSENPSIRLVIITNGSARSSAFWQQLGALNVVVHFALDGATAESHARYRRHTRFDAILKNAGTFIDAGGRASWVMLVFQHNQHEVETARSMASEMGFNEFVLRSTNRFYGESQVVEDEEGNQIDTLFPSDAFPPAVHLNRPSKEELMNCEIVCKVAAKRSLYVTADGMALPCCWLGSGLTDKPGLPGARDTPYAQMLHKLLSQMSADALNLKATPLPVIVNRSFPHFSRRWATGRRRLVKCATICGKAGRDPIETMTIAKDRLVQADPV